MAVKTRTKLQKLLGKIAGYDENVIPKTKEQKLLNEISENSGGGGSSGGGVNMLTLYVNSINSAPNSPPSKAYKNPECTEEYESYIEASDAIRNADIIQIVDKTASLPEGGYSAFIALNKGAVYMGEGSMVMVAISTMAAIVQVALWYSVPVVPV